MQVSLLGRLFFPNRPPRQIDGGLRFCPRGMELEGRDVPAVVFDGTFPLEGSGGKAEVTVQVSYDVSVDPYYHWDYYVTNQSVGPNELQPYIDSDAMTMFWVITGLEWDSKAPAVTNQSQPSSWNGHTWDYLGDTGAFWSTYPNYLPFNTPAKFSFTTAPTTITVCNATFGDDAFGEAVGKVAGPGEQVAQVILFNVNTSADTADAKVGDGLALDANGKTSLRAAIEEGNASKATVVNVVFNPAVAMVGGGTVTLDAALPELEKNFWIIGQDQATNIVERDDEAGFFGIFVTKVDTTCVFDKLTIRNGETEESGGGIQANGSVEVRNCLIYNNHTDVFGGGVAAFADLTITDSEVYLNTSDDSGGGIYCEGTTQAKAIEVYGNSADGKGGGIFLSHGSKSTMQSVLVYGNDTSRSGGGIAVGGECLMEDSKIFGNFAVGNGAGIWIAVLNNEGEPVTLSNVEVSKNKCQGSGGGLYAVNSVVNSSKCTFSSNAADESGGGIFIGTQTKFSTGQISISNNDAGDFGGGLFLDGGESGLDFALFAGNTATHTQSAGGYVANTAKVSVNLTPAGSQPLYFE